MVEMNHRCESLGKIPLAVLQLGVSRCAITFISLVLRKDTYDMAFHLGLGSSCFSDARDATPVVFDLRLCVVQ